MNKNSAIYLMKNIQTVNVTFDDSTGNEYTFITTRQDVFEGTRVVVNTVYGQHLATVTNVVDGYPEGMDTANYEYKFIVDVVDSTKYVEENQALDACRRTLRQAEQNAKAKSLRKFVKKNL